MYTQPLEVNNLERDGNRNRDASHLYLQWDTFTTAERGGYAISDILYELQIKKAGTSTWSTVSDRIPATEATKFAVTSSNPVGLVLGQEYEFRIFAYSRLDGCRSPPSQTERITHALEPAAPTCIATANSHPKIVVSFQPADDNKSKINYYKIWAKNGQG
jgi:hypothetical protein